MIVSVRTRLTECTHGNIVLHVNHFEWCSSGFSPHSSCFNSLKVLQINSCAFDFPNRRKTSVNCVVQEKLYIYTPPQCLPKELKHIVVQSILTRVRNRMLLLLCQMNEWIQLLTHSEKNIDSTKLTRRVYLLKEFEDFISTISLPDL